MDNTTAISYINKFGGGGASPVLARPVNEIW